MKRSLLFLLTLFCFLYAPLSHAQESQGFNTVLVEIWPEFDQPKVLVIFHIQLPADFVLPGQIPLLIPKTAEISAVAYEDPGGGLFYTDYSTLDLEEWTQVLITTKSAIIQVEYYQPLSKAGNLRQIEFIWMTTGPVDEFSVIFQHPARSTNVRLDPESSSTQMGRFNLLYSSIQPLSLEANQTFRLDATYEKADDELSLADLPVEPEIPLEGSAGQVNWNRLLPWILGGIGVVFIVFGTLALFGFKGKGKRISHRSRLNKERKTPREQNLAEVYCHQCGSQAGEGDQYCRSCGGKLRLISN